MALPIFRKDVNFKCQKYEKIVRAGFYEQARANDWMVVISIDIKI